MRRTTPRHSFAETRTFWLENERNQQVTSRLRQRGNEVDQLIRIGLVEILLQTCDDDCEQQIKTV